MIRFYDVSLVGAALTPTARFPSHNAKAAAEAYAREYWHRLGEEARVQVSVVSPRGDVTRWSVECEQRLVCEARHADERARRKGARRG